MADAIIPVERVLAAVERATHHLTPGPNAWRSAWPRENQRLLDIRMAADWAQKHGSPTAQVALTAEERALLDPFMPK